MHKVDILLKLYIEAYRFFATRSARGPSRLIVGTYQLAATQINWAYFGIIALSIEGVRIVFEKATEIRRRYSEKADAKAMEKGLVKGRKLGREEGEREALARVRSEMLKRGIKLTKEDEDALFNPNGHSR